MVSELEIMLTTSKAKSLIIQSSSWCVDFSDTDTYSTFGSELASVYECMLVSSDASSLKKKILEHLF